MKIRLKRSWGTVRRNAVYDYPAKTAKFLVETVKVADYVDEPAPVAKVVEAESPKPRGRPKKSEYQTKVLLADVDE